MRRRAVPHVVLEDLSQKAGETSALLSDVKAAIGRDDILQIVFTSGTTAEPKGRRDYAWECVG